MLDNIKIGNYSFNNLKPLRKNFRNTNNRFSAQGYHENKKIKIYEIFDINQGPLRKFISEHNKLSKYFPKLITYDNKYIVEEWVDGETLKNIDTSNSKRNFYIKEVENIIRLMWATDYNQIAFDYFNYIHERLEKVNIFDLSKIPIRINHNDLSLDNIIVSHDGLKIIDNEFLGCSTGWIFNIHNSFLKEEITNEYFISNEIFSKLWEIRTMWSLYKKYD